MICSGFSGGGKDVWPRHAAVLSSSSSRFLKYSAVGLTLGVVGLRKCIDHSHACIILQVLQCRVCEVHIESRLLCFPARPQQGTCSCATTHVCVGARASICLLAASILPFALFSLQLVLLLLLLLHVLLP